MPLERAFVEVRRRTRPRSAFTNDASCERIIYALVTHLNVHWNGTAKTKSTH
jgi:transposase-like protein